MNSLLGELAVILKQFIVDTQEEAAWQKILEPCFSKKTYIQLLRERAEP